MGYKGTCATSTASIVIPSFSIQANQKARGDHVARRVSPSPVSLVWGFGENGGGIGGVEGVVQGVVQGVVESCNPRVEDDEIRVPSNPSQPYYQRR